MNAYHLPQHMALRFSTVENALKYMETRDGSLAVFPYIKIGERIHVNPDYLSAPFELGLVTTPERAARARLKPFTEADQPSSPD